VDINNAVRAGFGVDRLREPPGARWGGAAVKRKWLDLMKANRELPRHARPPAFGVTEEGIDELSAVPGVTLSRLSSMC